MAKSESSKAVRVPKKNVESDRTWREQQTPRANVLSSPEDDSPMTITSSTLSVTPRNGPSRPQILLTPTPANRAIGNDSMSDREQAIDISQEDWGDDAMLRWDGGELDSEDDVSSVAPEDAGLVSGEDDRWGRDAIIDFTNSTQEEDVESDLPDEEAFAGMLPEQAHLPEQGTAEELIARGMPDYSTWTVKKLQVSLITLLLRPPLIYRT